MNAQIILTPNDLPAGFCYPPAPQDLLNAFIASTDANLPGNFGSYNLGNSVPSVDDRNKPWHREFIDGSPDDTYRFFNGEWVCRHRIPTGFVSLFLGSLTDLITFDGGTNDPVSASKGPFWEEVSAAAARLLGHPGTLPSGSKIEVGKTGGAETVTITTDQMPAHTHVENVGDQANTAQVTMVGGPAGGGVKSRKPNCDDLSNGTAITTSSTGGGKAITILPPFFGIYAIRRTARIFRTPSG